MLDVVKIDVEAAEWPFLRNLVDVEPTQSDYIRQLLLEIHTPYFKPRQLNRTDLAEMIYYAVRLSELGFTVFRSRQANICCGGYSPIMPAFVWERCCYETFYVNTRLINRTLAFLPTRRYASAGNRDRNVSVRPSVTRR